MHHEVKVEKMLDIEVKAIKQRQKIKQAQLFKKKEEYQQQQFAKYIDEASQRNQ